MAPASRIAVVVGILVVGGVAVWRMRSTNAPVEPIAKPSAATSTTKPPPSALSAPPAAPGTLYVAMQGEWDGLLRFALEGATFFSDGTRLARVQNGVAKFDEDLVEGLPEAPAGKPITRVQAMAGKWPSSAWLAVGDSDPDSEDLVSDIYEWVADDHWVPVNRLREVNARAEWMTPFHDGALLLFRRPYATALKGFATTGRFWMVNDKPGILTPARATLANPVCAARVQESQITTLPSGELFIFGSLCEKAGVPAVERWAPGESKSTVDVLPLPAGVTQVKNVGSYARSSHELYLLGVAATSPAYSYVWRFDGKRWNVEKLPQSGEPVSIAGDDEGAIVVVDRAAMWKSSKADAWTREALPAAPTGPESKIAWARAEDGTRWLVDEGLWRSKRGGAWERVAMPAPFRPTDVAIETDGELWVMGEAPPPSKVKAVIRLMR